MSVPLKRDLALFWLRWVVVHTFGALLVWIVPITFSYISLLCFGLGGIGTGFIVGGCLGGLEAWVLGRYLTVGPINRLTFREAWTFYSCAAGGLGYLLFMVPALISLTSKGYPLEVIPLSNSWEVGTGLLCLIIWGLAQWYVVRTTSLIALLWIPVTVLGWVVGFYVAHLVTEPMFHSLTTSDPGLGLDYPLAVLMQVAVATAVYGLITGTAVVLYLRSISMSFAKAVRC